MSKIELTELTKTNLLEAYNNAHLIAEKESCNPTIFKKDFRDSFTNMLLRAII